MKKQFWYSVLTYIVALVSACLVNLAVCAMAVKIVNLFIVVEYYEAAIIKMIMSFVTVCGVVGAISFYESYKKAEFKLGFTCGSLAVGGLAHLVLSIPLMFYPFIAGGTRYLAGLIDMGSSFDSADRVPDIYLWTYLLAFGIYLVAEIAVAISCGYIGKHKRLTQRAALTEQKEQN